MSNKLKNRLNNTIDFDGASAVFDAAEQALTDTLLCQAAAEANAQIDYANLLSRIKTAAEGEGIVAFTPNKPIDKASLSDKKAQSTRRIKRLSQIALGIAAACVLGLGITTVMMSMRGFGNNKKPDDHGAFNKPIGTETEKPSDIILNTLAPIKSPDIQITEGTQTPVKTDSGTKIPLLTPKPSGEPVKNPGLSIQSLAELAVIDSTDALIPPALPDFMSVRTHSRGLRVSAMGESKGRTLYYDCTVFDFSPYELKVGQAAITTLENGGFTIYWHINSEQFLYICISGLEYNEALKLLATFYTK